MHDTVGFENVAGRRKLLYAWTASGTQWWEWGYGLFRIPRYQQNKCIFLSFTLSTTIFTQTPRLVKFILQLKFRISVCIKIHSHFFFCWRFSLATLEISGSQKAHGKNHSFCSSCRVLLLQRTEDKAIYRDKEDGNPFAAYKLVIRLSISYMRKSTHLTSITLYVTSGLAQGEIWVENPKSKKLLHQTYSSTKGRVMFRSAVKAEFWACRDEFRCSIPLPLGCTSSSS